MKKLMIFAVAAIALVACSRTFEKHETEGQAIGFGTWSEVMTKLPKTDFVANDEFDVFGFKWNTGPANQTTVFNGDDVKYDGTTWSYSPIRFWDKNFDNYTFFAAYPKDQLATAPAQTGLFVSNPLTYDGTTEKLLVAQKKDVAKAAYGTGTVALVFKHAGSLVDIKFKKHTELAKAKVDITSITLSGIQIKGKYTVASYDGSSKDPVGKTVSDVAGLGWEPADSPEVNAAASPYVNASTVSLAVDAGVGTANAADLISNLVVMPQVLGKTSGPKITINYSITTDPGGTTEEVFSYTGNEIYFGEFDSSDPDPSDKDNTDPRVATWMPGTHYTYYITINANAIEFSASISPWTTTEITGHYYLLN